MVVVVALIADVVVVIVSGVLVVIIVLYIVNDDRYLTNLSLLGSMTWNDSWCPLSFRRNKTRYLKSSPIVAQRLWR